jgi:hypothetical protein
MAAATVDWSQCSAVEESIPGKVSGAWVFRDTRMPVSIVFENLEAVLMHCLRLSPGWTPQ